MENQPTDLGLCSAVIVYWTVTGSIREYWPGCEGVVRQAPEGAERMTQSKPEHRECFDIIIRPAPEGAGRTTPEQTGQYSYYNTKL